MISADEKCNSLNYPVIKRDGVTLHNEILGFLRRNLKIHNKKVKEQAYKTLVRPHLEYAAAVWDPHQKEDIDIESTKEGS